MNIRFLGVVVVGLLVAAACGGSNDDEPATATTEPTATEVAEPSATATEFPTPPPPEPLTAAETEYLDAVAGLIADFTDVVEAQRAAIRNLWPTRERFFAEFENYNVAAAILLSAEVAKALEPPERFADDHAALLAWMESVEDWVPTRDEALASEDLLAFFATSGEITSDFFVMLVHSDAVFCSNVTSGDIARLCSETDTQLDPYTKAMRLINDEFNAQFMARSGFPPAMTDEETAQLLLLRQPAIILAFEAAITALQDIEPPEAFSADHERHLQGWTDQLSLSREITVAAEDGEIIYFFDELIPRSQENACSAFRDASSEFRTLIDQPDPCP